MNWRRGGKRQRSAMVRGTAPDAVGCDAEAGMMVEAAPVAALVVVQSDLLFQLLVVALDQPARLGGADQLRQLGRRPQVGEPAPGRLGLASGPLDQQPFLRPGLAALGVAVRRTDPQGGEARREITPAAFAPADAVPGGGGGTASYLGVGTDR